MSYQILRTDKANDQLHAIIQYIAEDSGSVDIALGYLETIERVILKLADAPYMGSFPRYSTLKKQGYRVLIVERHIVFYKVDDKFKRVVIYAVVDARRNYINLI